MERVTLEPAARTVAERVIAEEESRRAHLVVYLSGAHAYGFPSPDSDLDLKAIHAAPTEELLGFGAPATTFDRAEIVDGVEIDYTSNEIAHALRGILDGNGNFLERVLGKTTLFEAAAMASLRPLVRGALSRRFHRHYRGFAANQRAALARSPTVKSLLYVLRTIESGIVLLERGEIETDLTIAIAGAEIESEVLELVVRKRAGERTALDAPTVARWEDRLDAMFERLDAAHARSALPAEPMNAREVEAWLRAFRLEGRGLYRPQSWPI